MPKDNGFSLASIVDLRSEAHATIRHHAGLIVSLSSAIGDVDAALMLAIAERSINEQQRLVDAARRLAGLLDGGGHAMNETIDGIPVLRGTLVGPVFRSGDAHQIKVRCPHCRRHGKPVYHLHGWETANTPDALEHRGAHCADTNSPLRRTGYFVGLLESGGQR